MSRLRHPTGGVCCGGSSHSGGGGVAVTAYDWFTSKDYSLEPDENGQMVWKKAVSGLVCLSNCFEYKSNITAATTWHKTKDAACSAAAFEYGVSAPYTVYGGYLKADGVTCQQQYRNGSGPIYERYAGSITSRSIPPYDTRSKVKATEEGMAADFQAAATASGIPVHVPPVPPVDIPVQLPKINPDPYPMGEPLPLIVPTGNPVLRPDGTWSQPTVRVVPSPTSLEPWRVDVVPGERITPTLDPLADPVKDPFKPTEPNAPFESPTSPGNQPAPLTNPNPTGDPSAPGSERQPTQCESAPDTVGCAPRSYLDRIIESINQTKTDIVKKLDELKQSPQQQEDPCINNPNRAGCKDIDVPDEQIPKTERNITYAPEDHFGGGSCPADKSMTLHNGKTVKVWDWAGACSAITSYLRPIFLALAAFTALMILAPGVRES